ncbi:16S rRNA (uracil(1498)-N(3))-methyltransferase [Mesosutterella sp. OilRF-GAM-744-9]|uniref:Ribosomal RNA small subunit methyltransferase E n=1 Tax=Mesosutterella porci TaxID=2915351 RepID=A0ABS9MSK6_9BURK|nr:16S rRNA (uracil(1498)-N(3))-methyltransferase [Mesosutterella sp. oilRF-744-WT-GAM-9]MCG5031309.1 16S rRNA (uracil(1498)-N(3))-methyltransferase [Mesosutterella sp. oilRF-744-WT-GAM-9]MCI6530627.1 16S rRNA (uracil(1498)-N(3))-methyltransferase [Mesosutterella sp.]
MTTPRFYVPGPWAEGRIELPEKASHHAMIVLRLRSGDRAEVFDGRGRRVEGSLEFSSGGTALLDPKPLERSLESPLRLTLAQAFVSPEKLDWIVEKAVEIGAAEIDLFPARRCVTRLSGEKLRKRLEKLETCAIAACEQCGRSVLPPVKAWPSLEAMLSGVRAERRFILAPSAGCAPALSGASSAAFAVGPEGGFEDSELLAADSLGWERALLGPRILRTETAGLAALAAANAVAGDYLL